MIYTNTDLVKQEKTMKWGSLEYVTPGALIDIYSGKDASINIPVPNGFSEARRGFTKNLSIGETKTGNPRLNRGDDGSMSFILTSDLPDGGRNIRSGSISVPLVDSDRIDILAVTSGTRTMREHASPFTTCVIKAPKNRDLVIRVTPRTGDENISYIVWHDGKVQEFGRDEVEAKCAGLGVKLPSSAKAWISPSLKSAAREFGTEQEHVHNLLYLHPDSLEAFSDSDIPDKKDILGMYMDMSRTVFLTSASVPALDAALGRFRDLVVSDPDMTEKFCSMLYDGKHLLERSIFERMPNMSSIMDEPSVRDTLVSLAKSKDDAQFIWSLFEVKDIEDIEIQYRYFAGARSNDTKRLDFLFDNLESLSPDQRAKVFGRIRDPEGYESTGHLAKVLDSIGKASAEERAKIRESAPELILKCTELTEDDVEYAVEHGYTRYLDSKYITQEVADRYIRSNPKDADISIIPREFITPELQVLCAKHDNYSTDTFSWSGESWRFSPANRLKLGKITDPSPELVDFVIKEHPMYAYLLQCPATPEFINRVIESYTSHHPRVADNPSELKYIAVDYLFRDGYNHELAMDFMRKGYIKLVDIEECKECTKEILHRVAFDALREGIASPDDRYFSNRYSQLTVDDIALLYEKGKKFKTEDFLVFWENAFRGDAADFDTAKIPYEFAKEMFTELSRSNKPLDAAKVLLAYQGHRDESVGIIMASPRFTFREPEYYSPGSYAVITPYDTGIYGDITEEMWLGYLKAKHDAREALLVSSSFNLDRIYPDEMTEVLKECAAKGRDNVLVSLYELEDVKVYTGKTGIKGPIYDFAPQFYDPDEYVPSYLLRDHREEMVEAYIMNHKVQGFMEGGDPARSLRMCGIKEDEVSPELLARHVEKFSAEDPTIKWNTEYLSEKLSATLGQQFGILSSKGVGETPGDDDDAR